MTCEVCDKKSITKNLCKKHFIENFEKNVEDQLIFNKQNKILIGISGGLSSTVLAHVLKKLDYNITCAFVENNNSEKQKKIVSDFCSKMKIQLFTIVDQTKNIEKALIKFCENKKFDHIATGQLIKDGKHNKLYAELNKLQYAD
ncbi:MAG: hypothetical protein J4428_00115 [Candidatus Aenigmarchaeota archaeon]|nr:hypothetical protein [Candidatus Aenigmarchaeota archaeon]